ncbi:hypothetical protein FOZ61_008164 [Perkinsus olseni]|uniref:Protein arginine methyltransferase 10 n=1 Tax=Perkinsus olseni TaxID=32597 RepID=A0A7J6L5X1_PEROL|nr:hypothetical protein FOZ61_008164 [Perkinsus olseni]KAF4666839.1 hypothetical protein FOL46_002838 [Perkinsus olseni]
MIRLTILCIIHAARSEFTGRAAVFHATTTNLCNRDVKDAHGNPVPCGISRARETFGLTLPGMEDGSLTTREHIIITKDGNVRVKAIPSRPYQYFMYIETPKNVKLHQLYNHQAIALVDSTPEFEAHRLYGSGMKQDGWTDEGMTNLDGKTLHRWTKRGPQGLDKTSRFNYTAVYRTCMYPDVWTFFTDSNDSRPVKLVGSNSICNKALRVTEYSNYRVLDETLTVGDSIQVMYEMYGIKSRMLSVGEAQNVPKVCEDLLAAPYVCEAEREFFGDGQEVDWTPSGRMMRGATANQDIISYFDIAEGSAAYTFFHHQYDRRLLQLLKFEFPSNCNKTGGTSTLNFCLFVAVDATMSTYSLEAGLTFVDVNNKSKQALLFITVVIGKSQGQHVMRLGVVAMGTATVWQMGAGVSLSIDVTVDGQVSDDTEKEIFTAQIRVSVSFNVNLPEVGSIMDCTIYAKIGITAAPNNDITAYGEIGTSVSLLIAGAGTGINIKGNTLDNQPNVWSFKSEVFLTAWVNIIV